MMRRTALRGGFIPPDNVPYRYRDGSRIDTSPGYHPHVSTRFRNWGSDIPIPISKRELPELYRDRSECCGCSACAAVCPRDAIVMEPDEEGFSYPVVDASLCIRCQKCSDVCVFKTILVNRWSPSSGKV